MAWCSHKEKAMTLTMRKLFQRFPDDDAHLAYLFKTLFG